MEAKKRVLVADDNEQVRGLVARAMAAHGFEVVTAADGDKAAAAATEGNIDLVLLDVDMPGRSGIEVLGAVRAGAKSKHVPVIFLTGRGDPSEKIQGLRLGADDYLAKPFSIEELVARVDAVLARTRKPEGP